MKYPTVSSLCEGIAESIRRKEGSSEKINPQDFVERIENLQVGGGTSESSIEYLDVSGANALVKTSVAQYAMYAKAFLEAYNTKVAGMTLFALRMMVDNPIDVTSAIAIDFTAEAVMDVGGGLNKMTIANAVLQNGATQADIDSIPRITKEQFYTLE